MAWISNDAVSMDIKVHLNWYSLGHQFAELGSPEQAQFINGVIDNANRWDSSAAKLVQMDEILTGVFDSNLNELIYLVENFLDRVKEKNNEIQNT